MNAGTKKGIVALGTLLILTIVGLIFFFITHVTIGPGWVGYVYDRTIPLGSENTIPGTSVVNVQRTGRISINPISQEVLKYPTTIVARNWTSPSEGDNKGVDWSLSVSSIEGKTIDVDIYISVRPGDIAQIISSFGMKTFDNIVDDDIYGLVRGKLAMITQRYGIYSVQSSKEEIQSLTRDLLIKDLRDIYGIELVRFEIGTLTPPIDIQEEINRITAATNAVKLAELDRKKMDEENQKAVDKQAADSKIESTRRQTAADNEAYEQEKKAEGKYNAQLKENEIAALQRERDLAEAQNHLDVAKLNREAELESQKAFTNVYFQDKELDVALAAIQALNGSIQTIITDSDLSGFDSLFSLSRILQMIE